MAGVRVIWVGRAGPPFVEEGVAHYQRRIAPLQAVELVQVRAARHSGRDERDAVAREGAAILKRLAPRDTLVLLDERGRQHSTRELADWLAKWQRSSAQALAFAIGGAYGVDEPVRRRAGHILSLSRLTLPHDLVRLLLMEQLYRAFSLLAGHPYHHG